MGLQWTDSCTATETGIVMASLMAEHRYTRSLSVRFDLIINTLVTLYRFLSASTVLYVHVPSFWVAVASFWSEECHVTLTGGLLGEATHEMFITKPATVCITGALSIVTCSAPTAMHTNSHYGNVLYVVKNKAFKATFLSLKHDPIIFTLAYM